MEFTSYFNNSGGLIMSPSYLKSSYMFGIDLKDRYGVQMPDRDIEDKILQAQAEVETHLSIKLNYQVVSESLPFDSQYFANWGFIPMSYPVCKPVSLAGYYREHRQMEYPVSWLSTKLNSDGLYERRMNIVPSSSLQSPLISHNMVPFYGLYRADFVPDYWRTEYTTGFKKIPVDLDRAVGIIATINVLRLMGDIINGVGVQSSSIGIDGLSQSISKPSGSAFSDRIKGYNDEFVKLWTVLSGKYKGLLIIAC